MILCSAVATITSVQKKNMTGLKYELFLFHYCLGLIFDDGFQNVQSFHVQSLVSLDDSSVSPQFKSTLSCTKYIFDTMY